MVRFPLRPHRNDRRCRRPLARSLCDLRHRGGGGGGDDESCEVVRARGWTSARRGGQSTRRMARGEGGATTRASLLPPPRGLRPAPFLARSRRRGRAAAWHSRLLTRRRRIRRPGFRVRRAVFLVVPGRAVYRAVFPNACLVRDEHCKGAVRPGGLGRARGARGRRVGLGARERDGRLDEPREVPEGASTFFADACCDYVSVAYFSRAFGSFHTFCCHWLCVFAPVCAIARGVRSHAMHTAVVPTNT